MQAALRPQPNLRNVESMHQMMNLRGHHRVDYDSYLALVRHAAQTYDSEQQKLGNPKYCVNTHIFSFDYSDHNNEMFDESPSYDTIVNHDTSHEPSHDFHLQQNVARRDPRRIEDRPKIPQELWDKLDLAAKLWYCGRDKTDIDKIVANQTCQQSAQQTMVNLIPNEHLHNA